MIGESDDISSQTTDKLSPRERHDRRMGLFIGESYRQANARARMRESERFYDQYQIEPEKREEIEATGQTVVQYDQITAPADWLLGTERRTRIDWHILPRNSTDLAASRDAENKTALVKWISDTRRAGFERSQAWDDTVKAGLGWVEVGATEDETGCPVFVQASPWRYNLHDSLAERLNLSDRRFHFRLKCVDIEDAVAHFYGQRDAILRARQNATDLGTIMSFAGVPGQILDLQTLYGMADDVSRDMPIMSADLFNPRERVLLIECWERVPRRVKQPDGSHKVEYQILVSIMTEHDTVLETWSPYRHRRIPFVPLWAYREKGSLMPYGPLRRLIDKQKAVNRAVALAMREIETNRIETEEDAINDEVMDIDQIRQEVTDPEGAVVLAPGGLGKFRVERGTDKAEAHLRLAEMLSVNMMQTSAVNRENRGMSRSGESGKAIDLKQEQGGVLSAELFDNILLHDLEVGELVLATAEQYVVNPLVVPVSKERGQLQMLGLNIPRPDGTVENDITALQARFVVDSQAWRANVGRAMFESMIDLLGKLAPVAPNVVAAILDLVFEYADLPNKETVLERIRSVTGQTGPDNQMTPEQQAAKAQQAAVAKAQFDLQMEMIRAQIKEAKAKGEKLDAERMAKQLEALALAANAAQFAQMNPGAAVMADELLTAVGFQAAPGGDSTPYQSGPQPAAPGGSPDAAGVALPPVQEIPQ